MQKDLAQLKQELAQLEKLRLELYGQEAIDNYENSKNKVQATVQAETPKKKKNKLATEAFGLGILSSIYFPPAALISLPLSIVALKI